VSEPAAGETVKCWHPSPRSWHIQPGGRRPEVSRAECHVIALAVDKNDANRDLVKMGAAALAAVVAAVWAVLTFTVDRHAKPTPAVSADHGSIAAGHDANNNTINGAVAPVSPGTKP
jgi:hypothetical protein